MRPPCAVCWPPTDQQWPRSTHQQPDLFYGPGLTSSSVHHPSRPSWRPGHLRSDDDSLPFLGDPELNSLVKIHTINNLIGAATFKWLIDADEEVYTINIH